MARQSRSSDKRPRPSLERRALSPSACLAPRPWRTRRLSPRGPIRRKRPTDYWLSSHVSASALARHIAPPSRSAGRSNLPCATLGIASVPTTSHAHDHAVSRLEPSRLTNHSSLSVPGRALLQAIHRSRPSSSTRHIMMRTGRPTRRAASASLPRRRTTSSDPLPPRGPVRTPVPPRV